MDKWINILTERENQTMPLLWSWDMSGNILELSVPAGVKNEIDSYRQSVLQVGKMIQRIRNSYHGSEEKPTVQLFPNLMDIGLVAVVRAPDSYKPKATELPENGKAKTFNDLLELGKNEFSLDVDQIDLTEKEFADFQIEPGKFRTYLLSSGVSNPFVWVRTGYFLEHIQNFHTGKLMNKELRTIEKINKPAKQAITSRLQKNTIPQALVMIET